MPGMQTFPDISGDVIVWADTHNTSPTGNRDICGYRISTGEEFPIATGPGYSPDRPAISGPKVVWIEFNDEMRSIQGRPGRAPR